MTQEFQGATYQIRGDVIHNMLALQNASYSIAEFQNAYPTLLGDAIPFYGIRTDKGGMRRPFRADPSPFLNLTSNHNYDAPNFPTVSEKGMQISYMVVWHNTTIPPHVDSFWVMPGEGYNLDVRPPPIPDNAWPVDPVSRSDGGKGLESAWKETAVYVGVSAVVLVVLISAPVWVSAWWKWANRDPKYQLLVSNEA
ncbi:hypothetical protein HK097_002267 [Rhizophlyctis rosea]|uniref:Uncharacterized protein n=1 Tax=Rhizophlyctis rosea TaxID=64517 RepID=A0AAD5S3Q0_9FUNG|nr:hypothetical protein HK097_002267 [Rhizophlyctis rosea]